MRVVASSTWSWCSTCNAKALAFSTRESDTSLAHRPFESVGQLANQPLQLRRPQRRPDLLPVHLGIGYPQRDVSFDGIIEEVHVLWNVPEV